ncbi:MAG: beta-lactamase family protein, partial [Acidimicrobiia bacterium]|nr:beta-lactamase family protein [Acidimicrobiia bacterium]
MSIIRPRPRRRAIVLGAFLSVCVGAPIAAAPRDAGPATQLHEMFERFEAYGFSGAVRIVFGGNVLLDEGYGDADARNGVPATPETVFGVGSITKQFTAMAILVLEARGQLSTDDRIGTYLDFVPEVKQSITLHHLLTHTSGLPDAYWDQHRDLTRDAYLRTIMTTGELRSAPGTQYAYSNYGYDLLGRIVEVVAGQPYEAFLRASLFEPAGMSQTGFAIPEFEPARVARYH